MKEMFQDQSVEQIPVLENDFLPLANNIMTEMEDYSQFIVNTAVQYKEMMMMYSCAIKEVRTKLEVLNVEFNIRYQRNPINFINHRLKRTVSIANKLEKLGLPFSVESVENNLHDVAGIRVICSFEDDIYFIAKALIQQDDIELIQKKDYIANPKPNGYRSLHLILSVPVFFAEQKKNVQVEVQIRTIAMDFWASLEHQLKYKQQVSNEEEIVAELKQCADVIAQTDKKMLEIRKKIDENGVKPTEKEELMEKIARFDVPID